jgi:DNA ligase D-like protein (predicted ligase)/DNA ligase D-like protein (predicted 3'-phosphoesterase)
MKKYKPMLAKTAEAPFSSQDWIFEVKWDGIRAIAYVDKQQLSLQTRNQKELKTFFPELQELTALIDDAVLDGEIIVMSDGKVDFQTLLKRIQAASSRDIAFLQRKHPVLYIVFDILEKNGSSMLDKPLMERKKILQETLKEGNYVIISDFVEEKGEAYYQASLEKGLEGIMAKKKNSIYSPGTRSSSWLKIKKIKECDCVIFGYTKGTGNRENTFGALILGLYENHTAVFVGKVGTGFDQKTLEDLTQQFQTLKTEQKTIPAIDIPDEINWIKPVLVCRIGYQTVTSDGKLRMPRFFGIRVDKNPLECKMEQIKPAKLGEYTKKRDFNKTPEPTGSKKDDTKHRVFVVQEHDASHLHYDLRLEKDGVLKSWAVPKGVPEKQGLRRLAIQTEDHPLEYGKFHGTIPKGQYGAGTVKIWDNGRLAIKKWEENKIEFKLQGKKLEGNYVLVRFKKDEEKNWLLMKVGATT